MKAIVHIGTEKTGTTSIQEFLFKNRKTLMKHGYYFVQSPGDKNNRALPAYCLSDEKHDDFFKDKGITTSQQKQEFRRDFLASFQDEISSIPSSIHTVIISSEHFHSRTNTEQEVRNVQELLASFFSDFKIVCYLRDQLATCTSFYSTAIKSGNSPAFDDFVERCKASNIYYNYYEMLFNWEKAFGLESIDVSLFDRDTLLNRDLLDDFTAKIDPSLVGQLDKAISVENESLNYSGQILGKAINDIYRRSIKGIEEKAMHQKCHEIIYQDCKGDGEQVSARDEKRIYDDFAESNEKLREKFFPDRPVLFPRRTQASSTNKTVDDSFAVVLASVLGVIVDAKITQKIPEKPKVSLPDRYANTLRDSALEIEKSNLNLAFELMKLAQIVRPAGPLINRKVDEYRRKIDQ